MILRKSVFRGRCCSFLYLLICRLFFYILHSFFYALFPYLHIKASFFSLFFSVVGSFFSILCIFTHYSLFCKHRYTSSWSRFSISAATNLCRTIGMSDKYGVELMGDRTNRYKSVLSLIMYLIFGGIYISSAFKSFCN